jgi:hypothetical protein
MQSRARETSGVERFQALVGGIEEGIWVIRGLVDQLLDVWMSLEQDSRGFPRDGEERARSDGARIAAAPRGSAPDR